MRLWPWKRKPENRTSTFEGLVTDAIVQAATGDSETPSADGLAAVETAAGWIGRCFAAAEVSGDVYGLVTPAILEMAGRELVRRGEAVFAIDGETMPRLTPCGTWDIRGTDDPAGWWYRVDSFGASMHRTRLLPASSVIHARINADPVRPWQGKSPFRVAGLTAATAANSEQSASSEARLPTGRILAMPIADKDIRQQFEASVRQGGMHVVRGGEMTGERDPRNRWEPATYGPAPSSGHIDLRRESARDVLAACGLSAALFDVNADGTARREAIRQAVYTTISPWTRLVEAELRLKLDSPDLMLSFEALRASDEDGRSRAVSRRATAAVALAGLEGVSVSRALRLAGLGD